MNVVEFSGLQMMRRRWLYNWSVTNLEPSRKVPQLVHQDEEAEDGSQLS